MAAAMGSAGKTANSYIGSLIHLISKSDIRYEGFLFHLDPNDSTIGLRNVKSFGTEGRRKDGPQVSPSEKIFEYIYFRGSDIKDLQVISNPPPQSTSGIPDDPAIIQSHFSPSPTTMASASPGSAKSANVTANAQPILPVTPFQLNQPHDHLAPSSSLSGSLLPPPPVNISGLAVPNYWPRFIGPPGGVPHFQQHRFPPPPQSLLASHPPVQQQVQLQNVNTSVAGASSFSERQHPLLLPASSGSPGFPPTMQSTPSVQSNPGKFAEMESNLSPIPMPNYGSSALSNVATDPGPKMASPLVGVLNVNATAAPVTQGSSSVVSSPSVSYPTIPPTASSSIETTDVTLSKLSKLSPMTVGVKSGPQQSPSLQSQQTPDIDIKTAEASLMEPSTLDSTEEKLEPLPKSTTKILHGSTSSHQYKGARGRDQGHRDPGSTNQGFRGRARGRGNVADGVALFSHQSSRNQVAGRGNGFHPDGVPQRSPGYAGNRFRGRGAKNSPVRTRFKVDFDFEAMNEKFNKEEVWDSLGRNNTAESDEGNGDEHDVNGEAREEQPFYRKDDFFDSLSCDALDHESRKVKLSEQMKKDAETFGEIPRRQRGHGPGPRWAGASQGVYRGRGHGNARGGRGRGRTGVGRDT